jgi:hypothetical protein
MVREEFISVGPYSVSGAAVTAVMEIWGCLGTRGTAILYTTYGLPEHKEIDVCLHCGVAVQLHSFLTSTLVGAESWTSRPSPLNPEKGSQCTLNGRLGRLRSRSDIEARFLNIPGHSLVTVVRVFVFVFVFVYQALRPGLLRQ